MFATIEAVNEHKAMTGHGSFEKREKWFAIKYRSRTQIITEILQIAGNAANKTRIMYGASLSFKQMNEYLPQLVNKGLLEYSDKTSTYKITAAGLEALSHYQKLSL